VTRGGGETARAVTGIESEGIETEIGITEIAAIATDATEIGTTTTIAAAMMTETETVTETVTGIEIGIVGAEKGEAAAGTEMEIATVMQGGDATEAEAGTATE